MAEPLVLRDPSGMRRARDIWVGIIHQLEKSSLTHEEFAKQRGIPVGTLRSWIYKLRRDDGDEIEETPPLLPVRVIASTAPRAREDSDGVIEVELGAPVRLRFPPGTSPGTIVEILVGLRSRC